MTVKHPFRHRALRFIRDNAIIPPNKSILISYSGGGDSVFLLEVLQSLKDSLKISKIGVLFFDHQCGHDPAVEEIEKQIWKFPEVKFYPVTDSEFKSKEGSFEEKARDARYSKLQICKDYHKYDLIATGHTVSDQAETVLYKFVTAGFFEALSGIKVLREDNVIRPLMCFSRQEIRDYLNSNNISYWQDPSNSDDNMCVRNKLRNQVMPILHEINPKFEFAISRLSLGLQGIVLRK